MKRTLAIAGVFALATNAHARDFKRGSDEARWPIKTSVKSGASLSHPKDVALTKLLALGDVPGVKAKDARFTDALIPDAVDGLKEGQIVRTKGWVHVVAYEGDGDYHIQITNLEDLRQPLPDRRAPAR